MANESERQEGGESEKEIEGSERDKHGRVTQLDKQSFKRAEGT